MASPQTRLGHAVETAYAVALRARPRAAGPELWAGPRQLMVVVPEGGLHFHQPYCPRAGPMHRVCFMPLTRALRQSLSRCLLCWPLHRQSGCHAAGPPAVDAPSPDAGHWVAMRRPRPPRLTLCLPRLPSPRTRLQAPRPSDYVAEWQVLTAVMQAVLPCAGPSVLCPTSCALLPSTGHMRLGWPEMLQAARRLLQTASVSGTWPAISALYGGEEARHLSVLVPRTRLASFAPLGAYDLPPFAPASTLRIGEAVHRGRLKPGQHNCPQTPLA